MRIRFLSKINNQVAVTATCTDCLDKAQTLASKLNLPLLDTKNNSVKFPFLLVYTSKHLELRENTNKRSQPILVDFLSSQLKYRVKYGGGKKQLIAKAIGIKDNKNLTVIDATAGFGTDAFILASLGCHVTMIERSPIVGALLEDGLNRIQTNSKQKNLSLIQGDSITELKKIITNNLKRPDLIYLDPMYPERKKSALNKKIMRILYVLVGQDNDASKLLKIAVKCARKRVVVKRPKDSVYLGNKKPDLQLSSGASSRYDIYLSKTL